MTKIYWGDAFTYIKQIDERPAFIDKDIKDRSVNIDTYLFKNYKKKIEYSIRFDKEIVVYNNFESGEPKELHFKRVTPEDNLEEIKDKYIWLEIPSLRFSTTKDWIFKAFSVFKNRKLYGIVSSAELTKFPWYAVEINARRIAGFKEIILPNNRRIHTNKKLEIIHNEKYLASIGFKIEDVYNVGTPERIKINMESYKMALKLNQDPIKTGRKLIKYTVKTPLKAHNGAGNSIHKVSPEKRKDIARSGGITTGKNKLIKKMEILCNDNKEFHHLVPYFKSRDPEFMMQALSEIMSIDSQRYLRGVSHEQEIGEGEIDSNVTQLSDNLFKHAESLVKLIKPSEVGSPTYNILNYKVNVGMAVENLNNAGLTKEQRDDLASTIDRIIEGQKRERVIGTTVVTQEPPVQGETS